MTDSASIQVSLIAPIYNEYENLPDLVARVESVMSAQARTWEFVCVDDGSRDGSDKLLRELAATRPWLQARFLRRNYGQSTAMQAGFDAAQGEVLVTIDGDMQNDPADIPRLLDLLDSKPEIDIISGWRRHRKDKTMSRKLPSMIANRLISKVTSVRLHDYGCSLKLYRREAVRYVKIYGELHRFIPALAHEYGAKVMEAEVNHFPRTKGVSKYGIDRTIRVLLDLMWVKFLLRFLHRPMHAFGGIGAAMFFPGLLILFYLAGHKLFSGADIGGRPLLQMGMMLTLMGANFIGMGILGEMLTRIWHEPGGKAQYLLREPPSE
ncbi:MAG: glycosyltransferase family 2 protein [Pseudomonadota bacterium]|nr:glycosyltransferase family 2 protein [Pseudomonadota bacterium]